MPWFSAHAIMYVHFKDGRQDQFPVWENVLLIDAPDSHTACAMACGLAKEDEGDSKGTFTWADRPATWVFAGIRVVVAVSHRRADAQIGNGDEMTYLNFVVETRAALDDLVAGKKVVINYGPRE